MSLGSALQIAQNSLLNVTRQTNVVSRNVTDANNENYSRRAGVLESNSLGSRVVVVRTGANKELTRASLLASSEAEAQKLISEQLDQLNTSLNGIDGVRSSSAMLEKLHASMQTYSSNPSNSLMAQSVIDDARQVATNLNQQSASLQSFSSGMDAQISSEVANLNQLLSDFYDVNSAVVTGSQSGVDVNDELDQRDRLLRQISDIIPVNTISRTGNDLVLMTKGGATLFETLPRNVTFQPNQSYAAGTQGNTIQIDGLPVIAGSGANTSAVGSLSALLQMRDSTVQTLQAQYDEVSRSLITSFSETDHTGGGAPALAGLFTWSGAPSIPASGTQAVGLAAEIQVNAAFDHNQGGQPSLLRDGGANGAAYVANSTGGDSYTDNLISFVQRLDVTEGFDTQTGIGGSMSLMTFASQTNGWMSALRSTASDAMATKEALHVRLTEKLSNQTGVNIDEELAVLLQLEHSYEASARLISAVDEMLSTLMSTIR